MTSIDDQPAERPAPASPPDSTAPASGHSGRHSGNEPDPRDPRSSWFAPPERTTIPEIREHHQQLLADPSVKCLLDGYPEPAVLVDSRRQIVMVSERLITDLGCPEEQLLGLRIGEALACIHASEMAAGCGTSRFCRHCGAAQAQVWCAASSRQQVEECRITSLRGTVETALDLLTWVTPITIQGSEYMLFAMRDTSDEKRRLALERIFFHDILNVAGGLRGLAEMLPEVDRGELVEVHQELADASGQLVEEICGQRDLAAAERGELLSKMTHIDAPALMRKVQATYAHHPVSCGKKILIEEPRGPSKVFSDAVLLTRVLGNLVKNALEASEPGQSVRLSYQSMGAPEFAVWNSAVMPEAVRMQMFQRSFSTKGGTGRGLGSYSVKLLTERYLGGTVRFRSVEGQGTTFFVCLPS